MDSTFGEIDTEELKLESELINAKYQYLKYLRQKRIPKFEAETKNYVWDDTHWCYKYFFPEQKIVDNELDCKIELSQNECTSAQKKLYSKLCLICHPYNCDKSWANVMIQIINEANKKNDLHALQKIYCYYEKHKSFDAFNESDSNKEASIKQWESELWYLWSRDPSIKEVFVPKEKYRANLEKQSKQLREENAILEKQVEQLQGAKASLEKTKKTTT